ncbi:MAG TPA: hypothetical protein VD930_13985, partial [Gemmatimonadales bacterium]|nr:hypothetical protein [Gemmatimonadales bacterium]
SLTTILAVLLGASSSGAAQGSSDIRGTMDRELTEITGRLRSFYYNLHRGDWESVTADILAAKVVAHLAAPEVARGASPARPDPSRSDCPQRDPVSVEHAVMDIQGDWAEVKVPRCAPGIAEDRFRLIRFSGRWRFVSIELDQPPVAVMVGR